MLHAHVAVVNNTASGGGPSGGIVGATGSGWGKRTSIADGACSAQIQVF